MTDLGLPKFAPFSMEPNEHDVETLRGCVAMLEDVGGNVEHATSVLTEAVMIAARCVRDREGRRVAFRLGGECLLAENTPSTEASIAWQMARILLRSGLVKIEDGSGYTPDP